MTDLVPVSIKTSIDSLQERVNQAGTDLQSKIEAVLGQAGTGADLDPMKLLDLQFKMGQFNAMIEAASSVSKGLTDTAKTLAQRAGG